MTNPSRHIRPMITRYGKSQHLAYPVTLNGRTFEWVSLCGVAMSTTWTALALRKHRGHTGRPDCTNCVLAIHTPRPTMNGPLRILAANTRR